MISESEVAQLCPTLHIPMNGSLPVSSIHGIFQARVMEWGAIAFSITLIEDSTTHTGEHTPPEHSQLLTLQVHLSPRKQGLLGVVGMGHHRLAWKASCYLVYRRITLYSIADNPRRPTWECLRRHSQRSVWNSIYACGRAVSHSFPYGILSGHHPLCSSYN